MSNPKLSVELAQQALDVLAKHNGNLTAAAHALALPRETFANRVRTARRYAVEAAVARHDQAVAKPDAVPVLPPAPPAPPAAPKIDARSEQGYKDRITSLRKEITDLRRAENKYEAIKHAVLGAVEHMVFDPVQWETRAKKAGVTGTTPLLMLSDLHFGEVVDAAELGGVNGFDKNIAADRYKLLIDKTIELCFVHEPNPSYPNGIVYCRNGDLVSGDIHDELTKTNDLNPLLAVQYLIELEIEGIKRLVDKFGRVRVVTTYGNHGRMNKKPESKQRYYTNFDILSGWMLELHFRNSEYKDRITFESPVTGDAILSIEGYSVCVTHGDRPYIGGGDGIIGAAGPIIRSNKKRLSMMAQLGVHPDFVLIGHYHQARDFGSLIVNGCLPGFNEYAKTLGLGAEPASQTLLIFHPEYGISKRWVIQLSQLGGYDV